MKIYVALIIGLACPWLALTAQCPAGWMAYGDHCYHFSDHGYTFDVAREVCKSREGELVAFNSAEERDTIQAIVTGTLHQQAYLGLIKEDGKWKWIDGSEPGPEEEDIVDWQDGYPNEEEGADCAYIGATMGGWLNSGCEGKKRSICKRRNDVYDMCDIDNNWHPYDSHCYKYYAESRDWYAANEACIRENGHLIMLETESKYHILSEVIECTDYERGIWIGLSDRNTSESYKWVDGSTVSTANWVDGQPPEDDENNAGDHCVESSPIESFKWRTDRCSAENNYICQRAQSTCYPGWLDYSSGACYQMFGDSDVIPAMTWSDADKYCGKIAEGGMLAKISDSTKQEALKKIREIVEDSGFDKYRIGLVDKWTDNTMQWSDQTPTDRYNYWGDTDVDNVDDRWDCGYFRTSGNEAKWRIGYCFDKMPFVCEIPVHRDPTDVAPVPEQWECQEGWLVDQVKGNCYYLSDDEDIVKYDQLSSKCSSLDAEPAIIEDEDDQTFVSDIIRTKTYLPLEYDSNCQCFHWYDGKSPSFENWDVNGQEHENDNRVAYLVDGDRIGSWAAGHPSKERPYLCKKSAIKTTSPPSTAAPPTPPNSEECGSGWYHDPMGGSCYLINHDKLTWEEARENCKDVDADLASITGTNDQSYITALVKSMTGSSSYWTGGNDLDQESGWKWSDGSPFAYFYWADGEPNDAGGEEWCIEVETGKDAKWNDHHCTEPRASICKKSVEDHETEPTVPPTQPSVTCDEPEALLSGNHYIMDWGFYGTSTKEGSEPYMSRIDSTLEKGGGGWTATDDDDNPHLSLTFTTAMHVTSVVTQGHESRDEWVEKYTVSYRLVHEDNYQWVRDDDGNIIEFNGNSDNKEKVENKLTDSGILATRVRIHSKQKHGAVSLRVELFGCFYSGCSKDEALVSGDTFVPDDRMTASSVWDEYHGPERARLQSIKEGDYRGSWVPYNSDKSQWIQVEFDVFMTVQKIKTKGREDYPQWTTSYKVQFSQDGENWLSYQEPYGTFKVFAGNSDQNSAVEHRLHSPMRAKFVRVIPESWEQHGIALRLEIRGCRHSECSELELISGDNHYLADGHLTASSQLDGNHGPSRSRLHEPASGDMSGGWVPEFMDEDQWIQVDLGYTIAVTGVAIQGQDQTRNFVTQFYVSYSEDLETWTEHRESGDEETTLFDGNLDSSHVRRRYFDRSFSARALRINPTSWNNSIAIRWEVLGCPGPGSSKDLGCYADSISNRDLPNAVLIDAPGGMTRDYCRTHCFNEGYPYAGVQYSYECYCGMAYGSYGPTSGCNYRCNGDTSQTCGGSKANDVMTTGLSSGYEGCPDHWTPMGDNCYRVFTEGETWETAEYNCMGHGENAHLATVNSIEEQQFVETQLAIHQTDLWIGLHCRKQNYMFEWSNGDPVMYTNWARREPNSYGQDEDCVMIYYKDQSDHRAGKWNDDPCGNDRSYAYMCQMPKQPMDIPVDPIPEEGCAPGWLAYRWKCFAMITIYKTWQSGKDDCKGMGGNLARVEDGSEQAFLAYQFGERGDTGKFWTDLSNQEDISTFKYSNGHSPKETFWSVDYPHSSDEATYVIMELEDHGQWRNVDGEHEHQYICERERDGVVRPSEEPTNPPSGDCAEGWRPLGDNFCVEINSVTSNKKRGWSDAKADCSSKGADLISLHDQDTQEQLNGYLTSYQDNFWIGLNKLDQETGYVWSDGSAFEYNNWDEDQPGDDHDRNCVEILYSSSGKWSTAFCSDAKNWLCKLERGLSPTVPPTEPVPTAGPPDACAPDTGSWRYFDGRCWFFTPFEPEAIRSTLDWSSAEAMCNMLSIGSTLASIHTEEQNNFVKGQLADVSETDLWIGLNEISGNAGWSWSDGSPTEYRNWGENQPDEGSHQLCATMDTVHGTHGTWNNKHCSQSLHFVCAKEHGAEDRTTPVPTPMPGACPDGYLTFGDKCFKFMEEKLVWSEAAHQCENNLASVQDQWEMYFLITEMVNRDGPYWIGLHQYKGGNGEFGWSDNSQVTYTNWAMYQPDGGSDEGCVEVYTDELQAGQWNDVSCDAERKYICMRFKDPELEPDSAAEIAKINEENCGNEELTYWEGTGNCYRIGPHPRSWQDADAHCQDYEKGRLASVLNVYEEAFIAQFYYKTEEVGNRALWLGLHDTEQGGRYQWVDGATVPYTNWASDEPAEQNACVQMSRASLGKWITADCSNDDVTAACKITLSPPLYTTPPEGTCPPGSDGEDWVAYEGNCYLFRTNEVVTFTDAMIRCSDRDSELVSIHSDEETAFLVAHLGGSIHWQWIGLIRASSSGWRWLDNSQFEYSNWNEGEPSDPDGSEGENCAEMYSNGGWNDIPCEDKNGFICKVKQNVNPGSTNIPTTIPTVPTDSTSTASTSHQTQPSTTIPTVVTTQKSTPTLNPTDPGNGNEGSGGGMESGTAVGIAFGVIFGVIFLAFVGLVIYKRRIPVPGFAPSFDNPSYSNGSDNVGYSADASAGGGSLSFANSSEA